MQTAFLFPGQGSQFVGMAGDLYQAFPHARARIDRSNEIAGFDLSAAMFGSGHDETGDAERLRQTNITQPALFVHSLAVWAVLEKERVQPNFVAGHSLGEYSALVAVGACSFEDGLQLVIERGRLMAAADQQSAGTMCAVIGADDEPVENLCRNIEEEGLGIVRPANYNSPGQIVVSGDVAAVEEVQRRATDIGARKVVPLVVGGAFHSPLMEHASEGLAFVLSKVPLREPTCPVVLNVTAEPETDPEAIRRTLLEQLTSPVRWAQSIAKLNALGVTRYVEIGAGRVLSGLVKRCVGRTTETVSVGTVDEINNFMATYQTQTASEHD